MRPPAAAAAAPPYRCSPGVETEHSIVKPQNWANINYWLLLLGEYFPYHQEGSDIHVPTKLQVSSTVMTQETELHINIHQLGRLAVEVETWVVAIFTLPITLPHPGHAIVGCSILVLTSARDMTRTRGWGPGCCRRLGWAGLGWAGLGWAGGRCACCSACTSPAQHCHHTQLTARATYTPPPWQIIIPTHYILLILYRYCLNKSTAR